MKHYLITVILVGLAFCATPAQAKIKVHCVGQGPLLYLIGGGPAFTTWNLQPIQQKLQHQYRVCRWDMRGVGENGQLEVQPGKPALAQWLQDMDEILPVEPVILWGHSWGALQVLLFAKQHPQRVSKLILSNPVDPALRSLTRIEQKRFNHPDSQPHLTLDDMGTAAEELYVLRSKIASYFADAQQGWAYAQHFDKQDVNNRLNIRIWNEYRDALLKQPDITRLANRISGVIYCEDDVLQPENYAEYRKLLPQQEKHHVLKGCAHFPWEENARDYFKVLFTLVSD